MFALVFFTTNDVKLAHFQYLASGAGLAVAGFRHKSYYASYNEPRTKDRTALLTASYESALAQWKKTHKGQDSGFFFLEDTSVRIDALSIDEEIPGVDVKFWMRDMTFDLLDLQLRAHDNNRRASVRSDIVLHVPNAIRQALGLRDKFLHFFGITSGKIVAKDDLFQPNVVFPWLDNRTFNRWFVPDGFDQPISRLNIQDANSVDFRKRAFDGMVNFLSTKGLALRAALNPEQKVQLSLPVIPDQPRDFMICGPSCAGKSTLASYLAKEYGYCHLEASDYMYRAFWQRHGPISTISIGTFAEAALREQPEIVAEQIREAVNDDNPRAFTVTGFRAPAEVKYLKDSLSQSRRLQLVYVDAAPAIRFKRSKLRQRESYEITQEEFDNRDNQELRMGLSAIASSPDVITIRNEGTLDDLYRQFRHHFSSDIRIQKKNIGSPWPHVPRHDLENLILVTLASRSFLGRFFTTSEIAKNINVKYSKYKRRVEKDNVSRYFNQNFHPFFEIQMNQGKRRYRLSNTGLARARMLRIAKFSYFLRKRPTKIVSSGLHSQSTL